MLQSLGRIIGHAIAGAAMALCIMFMMSMCSAVFAQPTEKELRKAAYLTLYSDCNRQIKRAFWAVPKNMRESYCSCAVKSVLDQLEKIDKPQFTQEDWNRCVQLANKACGVHQLIDLQNKVMRDLKKQAPSDTPL